MVQAYILSPRKEYRDVMELLRTMEVTVVKTQVRLKNDHYIHVLTTFDVLHDLEYTHSLKWNLIPCSKRYPSLLKIL